MSSKLVQVDLSSRIEIGYKQMVCWVESRPGLQPGCQITLKDIDDPSRLWTVLSVGRKHDRKDINRGWGMTEYMVKEGERR